MLRLSSADQAMLSGARGEGAQLAMQMIVRVAQSYAAEKLIDISWAHVASAYLQGQANLDFARRLADADTRVAVPTTLTACSLNLFANSRDDATNLDATELIAVYERMGCEAVMSCAPYHAHDEPGPGEHVAWCESSAVVYANSVLGARSNRYVEFVDMCAAITGRVPDCGLHRKENRRATVLFRLAEVPERWFADDWMFHALGILVGRESGSELPAIEGLPAGTTTEQLRALGSAAASSGSVSMFHALGLTPEAGSAEDAFQGASPKWQSLVTADDIRRVAAKLSAVTKQALSAICVGAPHFSFAQFDALDGLLAGRTIAATTKFYASTSAAVIAQLETANTLSRLMNAGVEFVVGRCTYYRPSMPGTEDHVMTNSAKWAYYAPSALGAEVTFGSLEDCVESACAGRVIVEAR